MTEPKRMSVDELRTHQGLESRPNRALKDAMSHLDEALEEIEEYERGFDEPIQRFIERAKKAEASLHEAQVTIAGWRLHEKELLADLNKEMIDATGSKARATELEALCAKAAQWLENARCEDSCQSIGVEDVDCNCGRGAMFEKLDAEHWTNKAQSKEQP